MAIDAQVILRNHARRMLLGAAEVGGWDVVLPVTAALMAKQNCAKVVRGYARKKVDWELALAGQEMSDEARGLLVHERVQASSAAFARWLDQEPRRNDRLFEIGERTRRAEGVAMELDEAGVVDDPDDTRWSIGEDPYVLAEALEAGAHWIASGNFKTLRPERMEEWLDDVQAQGRFTHVPRPFILSPEKAVRTMLESIGVWQRYGSDLALTGLANALCEPKKDTENVKRRVAILTRFAKDLGDAGMAQVGKSLTRWCTHAAVRTNTGRTEEIWEEIRTMQRIILTSEVRRTREAEDRRIELEHTTSRTPARSAQRRNKRGGPSE